MHTTASKSKIDRGTWIRFAVGVLVLLAMVVAALLSQADSEPEGPTVPHVTSTVIYCDEVCY